MATLYPYNTNWMAGQRKAQSDAPGVLTTLGAGVMYSPGSPVVGDVDWFVASANMKVGAYVLAHTAPDCGARNVTVTQTITNATEDTNGTIVIVGKDLAGNTITETLTPNGGATVAGVKAFATITSITGVGWVVGGADPDTVTLGFGAILGLPDKLTDTAQFMAASFNNASEALAGKTVSATALESNTFTMTSALNGSPVKVYYWL